MKTYMFACMMFVLTISASAQQSVESVEGWTMTSTFSTVKTDYVSGPCSILDQNGNIFFRAVQEEAGVTQVINNVSGHRIAFWIYRNGVTRIDTTGPDLLREKCGFRTLPLEIQKKLADPPVQLAKK